MGKFIDLRESRCVELTRCGMIDIYFRHSQAVVTKRRRRMLPMEFSLISAAAGGKGTPSFSVRRTDRLAEHETNRRREAKKDVAHRNSWLYNFRRRTKGLSFVAFGAFRSVSQWVSFAQDYRR